MKPERNHQCESWLQQLPPGVFIRRRPHGWEIHHVGLTADEIRDCWEFLLLEQRPRGWLESVVTVIFLLAVGGLLWLAFWR